MQHWRNIKPFEAVRYEVMRTSSQLPCRMPKTALRCPSCIASSFRYSPFLYSYPLSSRENAYPDGSNALAMSAVHSSQRDSLSNRRRRRKKGGMPERYELDQDLQGNLSLSSILPPLQSLEYLPDTWWTTLQQIGEVDR